MACRAHASCAIVRIGVAHAGRAAKACALGRVMERNPMRKPSRNLSAAVAILVCVVATPIALLAQAAAQAPTPGTFPRFTVPRMADGRPNLNGIWQALVTANFNLEDHEAQAGPFTELVGTYTAEAAGQSVVEGGVIPYKPEALAKRKQNFENRAKVDVSRDDTWHDLGDPELKCYMPGIPRATYMGFPFQIVQGSSDAVLFTYEFASAARVVRMNLNRKAPVISGWAGRADSGKVTRWSSTSPGSARKPGSTARATIIVKRSASLSGTLW